MMLGETWFPRNVHAVAAMAQLTAIMPPPLPPLSKLLPARLFRKSQRSSETVVFEAKSPPAPPAMGMGLLETFPSKRQSSRTASPFWMAIPAPPK